MVYFERMAFCWGNLLDISIKEQEISCKILSCSVFCCDPFLHSIHLSFEKPWEQEQTIQIAFEVACLHIWDETIRIPKSFDTRRIHAFDSSDGCTSESLCKYDNVSKSVEFQVVPCVCRVRRTKSPYIPYSLSWTCYADKRPLLAIIFTFPPHSLHFH